MRMASRKLHAAAVARRVSPTACSAHADYAQVRAGGKVTKQVAQDGLDLMDVDALGLDRVDRNVLLTMIDKFVGGPVGLIRWPRLPARMHYH